MTILHRLWDVLGLGTPLDEVEYEAEDLSPQAAWQDDASRSLPPNNVIGLPDRGTLPPEVLLFEPRSFEEVPQAVSALKQRKSVILNLSLVDADTAQRCVDFVAGGAFAIDGHQERVGETIFLFTPGFVQISHSPAPGSYPPPRRQPPPAPHTPDPLNG